MVWLYLGLAGVLEIGLVFSLKASHGFTRPWPTIFFVVCELTSFYFLSQALKVMPAGTAYALWTGIGAVGTVLVGMLFLGEDRDFWRLLSIALIVAGVLGLRFVGGES